MEGLLIGYIILVILVNIVSFIVLSRCKQQRKQLIEDTGDLHRSMEEFVTNLEIENDEFYHKLIDYIKVKESKLDERIRIVEEKMGGSEVLSASIIEYPVDNLDDEMQITPMIPKDSEPKNEKITKLFKQGFSPKQISKILQIDYGEVELTINVFRKKQSYHK